MKHTQVRMQYHECAVYTWRFWHDANAALVGVFKGGRLQRKRKCAGWVLQDHEGYERHCEGNWADFVTFFNATAERYGMTNKIS